MPPKVSESFLKVLNVITPFLAPHHYIIHICRHIHVQLHHCSHCSVESAPCIPETLGHFDEAIRAEGRIETGLVFISFLLQI
jgi:hypothetical protein